MAQPPEPETEATLYSLATEFLCAAEVLRDAPVLRVNVSLVVYYLLGHAAELFLKSSLCKAGVPMKELKYEYGHNLTDLAARAASVGERQLPNLTNTLALSETYFAKRLEYRQQVPATYPPLDLVFQEVRALGSFTFNALADFQGAPSRQP